MSSLSGSNILIVGEAPGTIELRERLINFGANVHVVSIAGAKLLLQQKQIDTAFIAASLEHDTRNAEARVVVPTHGRLHALLGLRLDSNYTRLRLDPVSPGCTALEIVDSSMVEYQGGIKLPQVLPGEYRVRFEIRDAWNGWMPVTMTNLVTITPGETTTVILDE